MAIYNAQLGLTATNLLTVPASTTSAVLSIIFCNTTSSARTVTAYAYPTGGSAGDSTTIAKTVSIPAYDTWIWTGLEKMILDAGGVVSALSDSAASVTATINYYNI
jgi:hypothetical protein